jgi:hypothetical protein
MLDEVDTVETGESVEIHDEPELARVLRQPAKIKVGT